MRAWSRLCQPEPPGTPAGVCLHRQSAAGPPRSPALFLLFYLMRKDEKGKITIGNQINKPKKNMEKDGQYHHLKHKASGASYPTILSWLHHLV